MAPVDIQSQDARDLLDIIDNLRSQGLGRYVNLPQIIVCGDQSSGKSSVLEAISGLSFPTKDNLCTRFATELILRRDPVVKVDVSILPHHSRSDAEKERLQTFTANLEPESIDIGPVIEAAKTAMGLDDSLPVGLINGARAKAGRRFSDDVLRIELSGPTQPHLTLVDLPGLFQAGNSEQASEEAPIVKKLVLGYMKSSRSIILAVVSAANDFANQSVTRHSRRLDPHGLRTIGLITKPDKLDANSDSERAYVRTAMNQDVVLKLGWHVLRNRGFDERQVSSAERDDIERAFFEKTGSAWKAVNPDSLGVGNLRSRLSSVLRDQIVQQLPSLVKEIETMLLDCSDRLDKLGTERVTPLQQRQYLSRASSKFSSLMRAAVDGNFTDLSFFGSVVGGAEPDKLSPDETADVGSRISTEEAYRRRLRAVVQNHLTAFRKDLHHKGHSLQIVDDDAEAAPRSYGPPVISRSGYIAKVKDMLSKSRGRELPGLYNPIIVSDLFREQSKGWGTIADGCLATILGDAFATIRAALYASAVSDIADKILQIRINPAMDELRKNMYTMLSLLNRPQTDSHPITYNHYLTDTVQKIRRDRLLKIAENMTASKQKTYYISEQLQALISSAFDAAIDPDMEKVAASDVIDYMEAYYKVALKRYTDDVAILVVEQALISMLPDLFTPDKIYDISDEEVARMAKESEASTAERQRLTAQRELLQTGIRELRNLDVHNVPADSLPEAQYISEGTDSDSGEDVSQDQDSGDIF